MTEDIKAIRDALAAGPSTGGGHIYTHPRDDNRHAENFKWHQACSPERIARLLDALDQAQKDAARYQWLRDNFTTDPRACGLHACQTPERLDAHFDAAMKEAP